MSGRLLAGMLAAAAIVVLASCESSPESPADPPARLVPVDGTDLQQVVLSEVAAQRIAIETAPVRTSGNGLVAVPAAAVVYDANGGTWVYVEVAPLTFVRQRVTIAEVDAEVALLRSGPTPGARVVTVGAAELLGSEYGVQGE